MCTSFSAVFPFPLLPSSGFRLRLRGVRSASPSGKAVGSLLCPREPLWPPSLPSGRAAGCGDRGCQLWSAWEGGAFALLPAPAQTASPVSGLCSSGSVCCVRVHVCLRLLPPPRAPAARIPGRVARLPSRLETPLLIISGRAAFSSSRVLSSRNSPGSICAFSFCFPSLLNMKERGPWDLLENASELLSLQLRLICFLFLRCPVSLISVTVFLSLEFFLNLLLFLCYIFNSFFYAF